MHVSSGLRFGRPHRGELQAGSADAIGRGVRRAEQAVSPAGSAEENDVAPPGDRGRRRRTTKREILAPLDEDVSGGRPRPPPTSAELARPLAGRPGTIHIFRRLSGRSRRRVRPPWPSLAVAVEPTTPYPRAISAPTSTRRLLHLVCAVAFVAAAGATSYGLHGCPHHDPGGAPPPAAGHVLLDADAHGDRPAGPCACVGNCHATAATPVHPPAADVPGAARGATYPTAAPPRHVVRGPRHALFELHLPNAPPRRAL